MKASLFPAATVTVSSKGQFCIPKRIRDALGMKPGCRVVVERIAEGFAARVLQPKLARKKVRVT